MTISTPPECHRYSPISAIWQGFYGARSSPMASAFRDRTSEFQSLSDTLRRIGGVSGVDHNGSARAGAMRQPIRSEFNKNASLIGLGIQQTSQKISRLSKLAKRSSMFDDPIVEIQELTDLIKNDITALNNALSDIQTIQKMEMADGNCSEDTFQHSTAVCDDLKNNLMGATKN